MLEFYLEMLRNNKKSENTISSYRRYIKEFLDFFSEKTGLEMTEELIEKMPYSRFSGIVEEFWFQVIQQKNPQTINVSKAALSGFLSRLHKRGLTQRDASELIGHVPVTQKKEGIEYSPDQIRAMLTSEAGKNKARNRAIIALFLATGLRVSELCALTVRDFYLWEKGKEASVLRKGNKTKEVVCGEFAIPLVRKYLESRKDTFDEDSPLFVNRDLNQMTRVGVYKVISYIQKSVGVETGIHNFRHTVMTNVNRTGNIGIARDVASHESASTTGIYIHSTVSEKIEAINKSPYAEIILNI